MHIYKEKAGVISKTEVWVAINKGYMYIGNSLLQLLYIIVTEWKCDKHLW